MPDSQRTGQEQDWIYGIHPVLQALQTHPQKVLQLWVQKGLRSKKIQHIIDLARQVNVKVRFRTSMQLREKVQTSKHQGVCLHMSPMAWADLNKVLDQSSDLNKAFWVILDHIQDPRNLGALIRSALAFGVEAMIMPKDRMAPVTAQTLKSSVGTALQMPLIRVTNLSQTIRQLKKRGFWIYGAHRSDSAQNVLDLSWNFPLVLVLGAEGKGLGKQIQKQCDVLVSISHEDSVESLNVSVAGSLLMYWAWVERQK